VVTHEEVRWGLHFFPPLWASRGVLSFHVSPAVEVEQAGHRVCKYGLSIPYDAGELRLMPVWL
jgi:hypothetical protein